MVRKRNTAITEPVTIHDLDDRRAAFVRAFSEGGGGPGAAADAAVAAGFARPGPAGRAAARVRGSELLRDPRVLEVLRDELTRKLNAGATLGVWTLIDLCRTATSEKVRLSAAKDLIDRGFGPVMSRSATIHADTTIEDMLMRLSSLSEQERARVLANDEPSPSPTIDHEPSNPATKRDES